MNQQLVRRGATVRNREGTVVGAVVVSGERTFIVSTRDVGGSEFSARYSDIERMEGDDVFLLAELDVLKRRDETEGGDPEGRGYGRSVTRA